MYEILDTSGNILVNNTYMSDKPIILLFIKAPIKGRVKSRLAADVGEESALDLYRNFILDIVDTVEESGYPFQLCFHPPDAGEALLSWLGRERSYAPQKGDDLGERMEDAFYRTFSEGFTRAVLIGSDLPDLPAAILQEAFEALASNQAVIGPAIDGGYYLIGFNKDAFLPRIFHDIEWGTDRVFQETMNLLKNTSGAVHVLPTWTDVDTPEDLRSLLERRKEGKREGSRTTAYLETHKGRSF